MSENASSGNAAGISLLYEGHAAPMVVIGRHVYLVSLVDLL